MTESIRKFKIGQMWSEDFDYVGMLKSGIRVKDTAKVENLRKLFNSFEDVNYHTASSPLWEAINILEGNEGNRSEAILKLAEFRELCKKELE